MIHKAEDLKDFSEEIRAVLDAARSVLKYRTFHEAARAIFDTFRNLIGASSGYVALLSEDGSENEVLFLESGGLACTVDPSLPMPIRGLRATAYHTCKPVFDNDFMNSKWMKFMPQGHVYLKNVLFAPLVLEGKAIGLIGIANKADDFNEKDLELAVIFSEIAAIALKNSYLLESLETSEKRYKEAYNRSEFYKNLLSHDFNNILQAILSTTQFCSHILDDPKLSQQIREHAKMIERNVLKGAELIATVAKLTEVEDSSSNLYPIELMEIINKSIKFIKEGFEDKQINVQIQNPSSKIYLQGNTFLQEVFDNILHNSVKFNPNSNIEISIKISEIVQRNTQNVKIEIMDNGIGIPDKAKDLVFERGYKLDRKRDGMGFGLFLVNGIITQFGGKIWVEDRVPGDSTQGSNFIILLPEAAQ